MKYEIFSASSDWNSPTTTRFGRCAVRMHMPLIIDAYTSAWITMCFLAACSSGVSPNSLLMPFMSGRRSARGGLLRER